MMRRVWALVAGGVVAVCLSVPVQAAPGDIVFPPREHVKEMPTAVFPHWFHRIRFRCFVCHEAIFPMRVTAEGITMDAIRAGEFCGACHNDRFAWGPAFQNCNRCHLIREDAPE